MYVGSKTELRDLKKNVTETGFFVFVIQERI
jgi:hypothetical protein